MKTLIFIFTIKYFNTHIFYKINNVGYSNMVILTTLSKMDNIMSINIKLTISIMLLAVMLPALAKIPKSFIYISSGELIAANPILSRSDIDGAQIIYNWRSLEREKNKYDFSQIETDLAHLNTANKKLFIQIQDRFFEKDARYVPNYLMNNDEYDDGISPQFDNPGEGKPIGVGWVARQWDPAVRERYQALLAKIAERFDGQIYGINLPETAIELDKENLPNGFTCDNYFVG